MPRLLPGQRTPASAFQPPADSLHVMGTGSCCNGAMLCATGSNDTADLSPSFVVVFLGVPGNTSMSAASSASLPIGMNDASAFVRDRPDEGDYKWAQDSYNSTQRTIDTW